MPDSIRESLAMASRSLQQASQVMQNASASLTKGISTVATKTYEYNTMGAVSGYQQPRRGGLGRDILTLTGIRVPKYQTQAEAEYYAKRNIGRTAENIGMGAAGFGLGHVGGVIGGAVGSAFGPLGTFAGYMVGSTVVDAISPLKDFYQRRRIEDYLELSSGSFVYGLDSEHELGRGFTRRQQKGISRKMLDVMGNEFTLKDQEMNEILTSGISSGLFTGANTVDKFVERFENLKDNVKEIMKVLGKTATEGLDVIKELNRMGIPAGLEVATAIRQTKQISTLTGVDPGQFISTAGQYSAAFQPYGIPAGVSAHNITHASLQIPTLAQLGDIGKNIVDMYGGETEMAQNTAMAMGKFITGRKFKTALSGMTGTDFKLDQKIFEDYLAGNVKYEDLLGFAVEDPLKTNAMLKNNEALNIALSSMEKEQLQPLIGRILKDLVPPLGGYEKRWEEFLTQPDVFNEADLVKLGTLIAPTIGLDPGETTNILRGLSDYGRTSSSMAGQILQPVGRDPFSFKKLFAPVSNLLRPIFNPNYDISNEALAKEMRKYATQYPAQIPGVIQPTELEQEIVTSKGGVEKYEQEMRIATANIGRAIDTEMPEGFPEFRFDISQIQKHEILAEAYPEYKTAYSDYKTAQKSLREEQDELVSLLSGEARSGLLTPTRMNIARLYEQVEASKLRMDDIVSNIPGVEKYQEAYNVAQDKRDIALVELNKLEGQLPSTAITLGTPEKIKKTQNKIRELKQKIINMKEGVQEPTPYHLGDAHELYLRNYEEERRLGNIKITEEEMPQLEANVKLAQKAYMDAELALQKHSTSKDKYDFKLADELEKTRTDALAEFNFAQSMLTDTQGYLKKLKLGPVEPVETPEEAATTMDLDKFPAHIILNKELTAAERELIYLTQEKEITFRSLVEGLFPIDEYKAFMEQSGDFTTFEVGKNFYKNVKKAAYGGLIPEEMLNKFEKISLPSDAPAYTERAIEAARKAGVVITNGRWITSENAELIVRNMNTKLAILAQPYKKFDEIIPLTESNAEFRESIKKYLEETPPSESLQAAEFALAQHLNKQGFRGEWQELSGDTRLSLVKQTVRRDVVDEILKTSGIFPYFGLDEKEMKEFRKGKVSKYSKLFGITKEFGNKIVDYMTFSAQQKFDPNISPEAFAALQTHKEEIIDISKINPYFKTKILELEKKTTQEEFEEYYAFGEAQRIAATHGKEALGEEGKVTSESMGQLFQVLKGLMDNQALLHKAIQTPESKEQQYFQNFFEFVPDTRGQ